MIESKPCFGKHKATGFDACGKITKVKYLKYGLCPNCYPTWLFSDNDLAKLEREKFLGANKNKVEKEQKVKDSELREKLKTLTQLENEAKLSFQKFIRLRDAELGCASCHTTTTDLWDGGHWKKAEIYSGLIFDERNCHKQCRKCNRYLGGNEGEYRIKLVHRFSEDWVRQLEDDANKTRNYKYGRDELIGIKKIYDLKIKELLKK